MGRPPPRIRAMLGPRHVISPWVASVPIVAVLRNDQRPLGHVSAATYFDLLSVIAYRKAPLYTVFSVIKNATTVGMFFVL